MRQKLKDLGRNMLGRDIHQEQGMPNIHFPNTSVNKKQTVDLACLRNFNLSEEGSY